VVHQQLLQLQHTKGSGFKMSVNLRIQLSALVFCFLFAVSVKPFQPAAPL
jgi:hypothetical protein